MRMRLDKLTGEEDGQIRLTTEMDVANTGQLSYAMVAELKRRGIPQQGLRTAYYVSCDRTAPEDVGDTQCVLPHGHEERFDHEDLDGTTWPEAS